MFGLGVGELVLILLVVVLLFGHKKIPELAKGLGQSINEFKKGQEESKLENKKDDNKNKET